MADLPLVARILSVSAGVRVMSGDLEGAQSQLREARSLAGRGLQHRFTILRTSAMVIASVAGFRWAGVHVARREA
jgi:hypothetical protein